MTTTLAHPFRLDGNGAAVTIDQMILSAVQATVLSQQEVQ